jgi:hypothetical protein
MPNKPAAGKRLELRVIGGVGLNIIDKLISIMIS